MRIVDPSDPDYSPLGPTPCQDLNRRFGLDTFRPPRESPIRLHITSEETVQMHPISPPKPLPTLPTAAEERAAVVTYVEQLGDRLAAANIALGEHVRVLVEQRPPPRDVRPALNVLLLEWRSAWDATPADQRAVETAAAIAGLLAAQHVERLDAAGLSRFHEFCGYPPKWSRPHAIASLVAFLMSGFRDWLVQQGEG